MNWFPLVEFLVRWAPTIEIMLSGTGTNGSDFVGLADEYFDAMAPVVEKNHPQLAPLLKDLQSTLHQVIGQPVAPAPEQTTQ